MISPEDAAIIVAAMHTFRTIVIDPGDREDGGYLDKRVRRIEANLRRASERADREAHS